METHNSLDRKEGFKQEVESLLRNIKENIKELSSYSRIYDKEKDQKLIDEMNRLKLHRNEMKQTLKQIDEADQAAWLEIREDAKQAFLKAKKEYLNSSNAMK